MRDAFTSFVQAYPEVGSAIIAAISVVIGVLIGLVSSILQGRSALAAQRMKLRYEIAREWLADFRAAAVRFRARLDRLGEIARLVGTEDQVRLGESIVELAASAGAVHHSSCIIALTCGGNEAGQEVHQAAELFVESVTCAVKHLPDLTAADKELLATVGKGRQLLESRAPVAHRDEGPATRQLRSMLEASPGISVSLDTEDFLLILDRFAALCATVTWAAEQRLLHPLSEPDKIRALQLHNSRDGSTHGHGAAGPKADGPTPQDDR